MKIAFYSDSTFNLYIKSNLLFANELSNLDLDCDYYNNPNTPSSKDYDCLIIGQLYNKHGQSHWLSVFNSFDKKNKKIFLVQESSCYDRFPFYDHLPSIASFQVALPPGIYKSLPTKFTTHFPNTEFTSIYFGNHSKRPSLSRDTFYSKYNLDLNKKLFCFFCDRSDRLKSVSSLKTQENINFHNNLFQLRSLLAKMGYEVIFKLHRMEDSPKVKKNTPLSPPLREKLKIDKLPICDERDNDALLHYCDLALVMRSDIISSLEIFNIPTLAIDYREIYEDHVNSYRFHHPTVPSSPLDFNFNDLCRGMEGTVEDLNTAPKKILDDFIKKSFNDARPQSHYVWGDAYDKKMADLALFFKQCFFN